MKMRWKIRNFFKRNSLYCSKILLEDIKILYAFTIKYIYKNKLWSIFYITNFIWHISSLLLDRGYSFLSILYHLNVVLHINIYIAFIANFYQFFFYINFRQCLSLIFLSYSWILFINIYIFLWCRSFFTILK